MKSNYVFYLFTAAVLSITACTTGNQDPTKISKETANLLTSSLDFVGAVTEVLPVSEKPVENKGDVNYPQVTQLSAPGAIGFSGQSFELDIYTDYQNATDVVGAVMYIQPASEFMTIEGSLMPVISSSGATSLTALQGISQNQTLYFMRFIVRLNWDKSFGGKIPSIEFALQKSDGTVGNYWIWQPEITTDPGDGGYSEDAGLDGGQDSGIVYPAPTVLSITPDGGINNRDVTVTNLEGANFRTGASVQLVKTGMEPIAAANVVVDSPTRIECVFNLREKAPGQRDVVVTNTDTKAGSLPNGFTVLPAWVPVGTAGFSDGGADYTSLFIYNEPIAVPPKETPYVAFSDGAKTQKVTVMKFNGTGWQNVGAAGFSAGTADYTSLYIYNGTPYVAYKDGGNLNRATVMKFNGATWSPVVSAGFGSGQTDYISLSVCSTTYFSNPYETPLVAFSGEYWGYKASLMKSYFNGATWSWEVQGYLGISTGKADYTSLSVYDGGTPYVAYKDTVNNNLAAVKKYNGSNWEAVGTVGFSAGAADYTSLYFNNDIPYVAYKDAGNGGRATVMKYNGTDWEPVGIAGFSAGAADFTSLNIYNGTPYVAYRDTGNGGLATVMKFNGSAWEVVGFAGFSAGPVSYTSLSISSSGTLYVGYKDEGNGNKATVMTYLP